MLKDAEERLEAIKGEIALLETQYAAYKTNFCNLMKRQFEFLKEEDFDADAYIDEKAIGVLIGAGGGTSVSSNNANFGSFTGDPQMRDESTLGGMANSSGMSSREELNSTSAVYTSNLGANDNFVDPFNPTNKGNGRYNPYDSLNPKKDRTSEKVEDNGDKKTTFTVNTGNKNRARRGPITPQAVAAAANNASSYTNNATETKKKTISEEQKMASEEEPKTGNFFSTTNGESENTEPISTIKLDDDVAEIVADVEEKINGRALLGEDDSSEDADEFGFEFI